MAQHGPSARRWLYGTFGWQGITLTVPAEWYLVATRGTRSEGYVRLADDSAARMELRWQTARSEHPPSQAVDLYLRKLQRQARKEHIPFAVQRGLNLAAPVGKRVECYRWVADRQALGMMSQCAECGRLVHVQLHGRPEEPMRGLARTVFSSLRDHSEDGTELWRFLDVEFRTPEGLRLLKPSLQSGCVRMLFGAGRTRLEFVRASLAEVVLARRQLVDWFREFYRPALKRRSYELREERIRSHPGVRLEGRPWLLVNPLRLIGRKMVVEGVCWHCEATNRLFVCCYDGPEAGREELARAVEAFVCCGDS